MHPTALDRERQTGGEFEVNKVDVSPLERSTYRHHPRCLIDCTETHSDNAYRLPNRTSPAVRCRVLTGREQPSRVLPFVPIRSRVCAVS